MTGKGQFDGQVVTVVGGGVGLGRQYCLDLAAEGAHVVVAGRGQSAADVADEIRARGQSAEACIADARDGQKIVAATLEKFGRIDGLVVNAGILRDRSFINMTEEEWREVFDVHVNGTYSCLRAVWPVMRDQRHGRIVLTATSGVLYGNFGQANYIAAKGAITSLTFCMALEGAPRNIAVNVVLPIAFTRLTESVFTPEVAEALPAEGASPFVLALLHPSCKENGGVFEIGGGFCAKARWERSAGVRFDPKDWNVSSVLSRWDDVVRFDERATHPANPLDSIGECVGPEIAGRMRAAKK